jgi:hypothetical protein
MQKNSLLDFLFKGIPLVVLLFLGSCNKLGNEESRISFNRDVRPILNDKCLSCHGGVKANSGFSLLFEEEAFGETQSGKKAIVRGNHKKSELFKRLVNEDPDKRMPFEANSLSADEIEIIKNWIDQGAKWEKHWAYIRPNEKVRPPEVNDQNWSKNSIDQFVFKKLTEEGFTPASEADKHTLIRRLTLDLTGLPPTMEEVQDFVSDNSPKAYENLVDGLFASPHFGERWATMWLDLARYADSKGFEKDTNREIWKYRDWVINAFNNDMPFDQFSIEQLAGDLLPIPTEEQLIATAFHRNTLANDEVGTDDEQFRTESVLERVATTYEVWQGTTMACVQCHSHPYDPFKHEEFYESMAFFNNAVDRDSFFEQPKLFTYSEENKVIVEELLQYIDEELLPEDKYDSESPYLHTQNEELLTHLGHRFVEAETFDDDGPFIKVDKSLNFVEYIQDSSWVKYEDVYLRNIEKIGFSVSALRDYAGEISVRLDSLGGKEIGRVKITNTEKSKEIAQGKKVAEFIAAIEPVDELHDLFLQFYKGEEYSEDLFKLDNLLYYEKEPLKDKYNAEFNEKVLELAKIPTTTTPIIQELQGEKARKTFVFDRGSWLSPGKEVSRGIPDIYDIAKGDEPSNRLEFAQWLVSEKNPLASRVAVNRIWEQLFGFGLVESMEEFGSQGEKPTHPALLDWMSIRFSTAYGWKMKPFLKELVLSATYRQSSKVSTEKIAQDPNNKWLARMGRTRLSGEQIRDQTLAVSGLLNKKIGGPSVKNADVGRGLINNKWYYIPDYVVQGDSAKYRRSLYTFWKRLNPPMNLIAFDSPDRSVCSSRRIRTNTPLQALNSLNDQTFFEASQALANKMLKGGEQLEDRIKTGYYIVMGKEIEEKKLVLLVQLYNETYQDYFENKNSDDFPEIALNKKGKDKYTISALTIVANTLLNLDEFIVKG